MRIRLLEKDLSLLFLKTKTSQKNASLNKLASLFNVNKRTLINWKRGKTTMPEYVFKRLVKLSRLESHNFSFKILPEFWHIKKAGRKGAYARMKLYGNIGTPEGRKKGGLASIITHKKNNTLFNNIKSIKRPQKSERLAELLGILFGDGHLSAYQASITTNAKTDKEHAIFTQKLIAELFRIKVSLKLRKKMSVVDIIASSRRLVKFLNRAGMPIGDKIKNNLTVPSWIKQKKIYKKAFIRGLFDTDGCIYLDKHRIKSKQYKHLGWAITSYASKLVIDVLDILKDLGFSPTNRATQKSVYLRRQEEIHNYFKKIKTNNPKHGNRFIKFIGEVPKWS